MGKNQTIQISVPGEIAGACTKLVKQGAVMGHSPYFVDFHILKS